MSAGGAGLDRTAPTISYTDFNVFQGRVFVSNGCYGDRVKYTAVVVSEPTGEAFRRKAYG